MSSNSSTEKGDLFEEKMWSLFKGELEGGRLGVVPSWCRIYRKKKYYSHPRRKNIIFDLVIEVKRPGADRPCLLIVIECKDYKGSVPVNDIEEFHSKLQQIEGVGVKGVFATTSSLQDGARNYAQHCGIGVLRHFHSDTFKWVLERSVSASFLPNLREDAALISKALSIQDFRSGVYDLYGEVNGCLTNSLWVYMDCLLSKSFGELGLKAARLGRPMCLSRIPFLHSDAIEKEASQILSYIGYGDGAIQLPELCQSLAERCDLKVLTVARDSHVQEHVLASISFKPLEICLYPQDVPNEGRLRFTLAHELGHFALGHERYMRGEYCEESDFANLADPIDISDVSRLEWQANHFASCLLLPKQALATSFCVELDRIGVRNKGFGPLFLDDQPCNVHAFMSITTLMASKFKVSKRAVKVRLEQLGLLVDARKSSRLRPATRALFGSVFTQERSTAFTI